VFKKMPITIFFTLLVVLFSAFGTAAQDGEQILRIATASSGQSSFDFNVLGAGGDQQNWSTLLYVPPMYFDADLNLKPGLFN